MKTQASILIALVLFFNLPLNAFGEVNYVITDNEDTILGSELNFGLFNAKLTQPDGTVIKVEKDKVETYFADNKRFDKLPVYMNGKFTGKESFMELVSQRNGLLLYKFICNQNTAEDGNKACVLAVFKGKDFYVQVDNRNAKTIADYFHVSNIVCN